MKIKVSYTATPNDILYNNKISAEARIILFSLIDKTNNTTNNNVFISQKELMELVNIKFKPKFIKIIESLEELGYITVVHNNPHKNQKGISNCYTVNYDKINKVDSAIESKTEAECSGIQVECKSELQNDDTVIKSEEVVQPLNNTEEMLKNIEIEHAVITDDKEDSKNNCLRIICVNIMKMKDNDFQNNYASFKERFEFFKNITNQIKFEFNWLKDNFPEDYYQYAERWNNLFKEYKYESMLN